MLVKFIRFYSRWTQTPSGCEPRYPGGRTVLLEESGYRATNPSYQNNRHKGGGPQSARRVSLPVVHAAINPITGHVLTGFYYTPVYFLFS